jgi:hypothetical protein
VAILFSIGIDILAYECDFFNATPHQKPGFLQDFLRVPAYLASSHIGHHTVGTEIVATLHNRDKGRGSFCPGNGLKNAQGFRIPPRAYVYDRPLSGLSLRYKGWKSPDRKRPKHNIHIRHPFDKTIPFLLSNTSSHSDHEVWLAPFHASKTPQEAVDLVFSLLTNGTGIHYNQIGLLEL